MHIGALHDLSEDEIRQVREEILALLEAKWRERRARHPRLYAVVEFFRGRGGGRERYLGEWMRVFDAEVAKGRRWRERGD